MGRVRRRVALLPQVAVSAEVLREYKREQLKVLDIHAVRRHSLPKLRIKVIHIEDDGRMYNVPDPRWQKHNVCIPD